MKILILVAWCAVNLFAGNVFAQPTTAPVSNVPAPDPGLRALNLTNLQWYASADLPIDASPETISKSATPTTPIITLRTPAGGSGTLFAIIEIQDPPGSGAQLTIGDIDGEDETHFNGIAIGATRGSGVTDYGIPRAYYVEPKLIKQGNNVLAIRMRGAGGKGSFGIRRPPLTFGFVKNAPKPAAFQSPKPARGVTAIAEADARAAIRAAGDATSETTGTLYRKRPSFGRFGKYFHDGLPMVSEVGPTRIVSRHGPQFDVSLDSINEVSIATGDGEPGIDGWHKLSRVKAVCNQKPVQYTMLSHVCYPGGIVTVEQGTVLQMRVKFNTGKGVLQALTDDEILRLFPGLNQSSFATFLLYEPLAQSSPAVVAAVGVATNATEVEGQIDFTFSRSENAKQPGKIYVFYPAGLRRLNLESRPGSFFQTAQVVSASEPLAAIRRWMQVGLNEPAAMDEYFEVLEPLNAVRVHQVARFAAPPGVPVAPPLLIPPPQVEFSRQTLRYPARLPGTTGTGIVSFSGPVTAFENLTTTTPEQTKQDKDTKPEPASALHIFSYDLPIPPLEERGMVALPEYAQHKAVLNRWLTDLGTTTSATGVDALYKSRTQGFQAFSYLTAENRQRLLRNSAEVVPHGMRDELWHEVVEPFSGLPFWWTYFIEGPYFDRYDQDWGNGLSLYGLYTWAKYTGNWDQVAQGWKAVEKMFSWFAASDDWEWMRASNGEHGHGTGAGDCANACYAGVLAYAKLAKHTGRTEDYHYGLYAAARAAVPLLNRFTYNTFADEQGLKEDNSLVIGFHEGNGFLVGELNSYPWNVTSNISGNGIQPENFDLYVKYAADQLREYESVFARAYPKWADASYVYPRPTQYRNNSGYITLPHMYLRARLRTDTQDTLTDYLQSAQPNSYLWWLAPPVVAEIINMRTDIYIADWGRCAFLDARLTRREKRTVVQIKLDNKNAPDTVEINLPRRQHQLTINGGPVPLTDSTYEGDRLKITLRRAGENVIEIVY